MFTILQQGTIDGRFSRHSEGLISTRCVSSQGSVLPHQAMRQTLLLDFSTVSLLWLIIHVDLSLRWFEKLGSSKGGMRWDGATSYMPSKPLSFWESLSWMHVHLRRKHHRVSWTTCRVLRCRLDTQLDGSSLSVVLLSPRLTGRSTTLMGWDSTLPAWGQTLTWKKCSGFKTHLGSPENSLLKMSINFTFPHGCVVVDSKQKYHNILSSGNACHDVHPAVTKASESSFSLQK